MPSIFDLFGFPLDDRAETAETLRKARQCPFMSATCDGGGNRYQTEISLTPAEPLTQYFNPGIPSVVPGVCSILAGSDIWVVCPRRLLAARYDGEGLPPVNHALQEYERDLLLSAGLPKGVRMGLWAEVALRQNIADADINYHFDFVAAPLVETTLEATLQGLGLSTDQVGPEIRSMASAAKKNGYFAKGIKNPGIVTALLPDISRPSYWRS